MERDLELMREILLKVKSDNDFTVGRLYNEGYDTNSVNYQLDLLDDEKYIVLKKTYVAGQKNAIYSVERITNAGQDYIDAIKDNSIWKRALEKIALISSDVSLDMVKMVCLELGKLKIQGTF